MADIEIPVSFKADQLKFISEKEAEDEFDHTNWGDGDLQDLRCFIRDYYRDLSPKCSYCKEDVSLRSVMDAHVEHIIPKSHAVNFMFEPKNLCVVCCDCNEIKSNQEVTETLKSRLKRKESYKRYPTSTNSFKIFHPHFDDYEEHIEKCGDIYVDLTDKGSFTKYVCDLNRKVKKYGLSKDIMDEPDLIKAMSSFMSPKDFNDKRKAFESLREYFIKAG